METSIRMPLSALAFGLLFLQLFSPMLAAATPTPNATNRSIPTPRLNATPPATPGPIAGVGTCTLSSMSNADVKRWWQAFGESGFQAEEVNAFSDPTKLQANQPGNVNVTVNVNIPGQTQGTGYANLTDVAQVLGISPSDAAKALGAGSAEDTVVTMAQAEALARTTGKSTTRLSSIFSQQLGLGQSGVERQPWEGYKIRLPSGKDIALQDLYKLLPIDSNECMINSQDIQGRVEYIALLNKDLTYGYQRSTSTLAGTSDSAQHFSASEANAALTLNGGANILIPSRFQQWITFVKDWNNLDMYLSLFAGATAFKQAASAKEEADKLKTKLTDLDKQLRQGAVDLNLQRQDQFINKFTEEASSHPTTLKSLFDPENAKGITIENTPVFDALGRVVGSTPNISPRAEAASRLLREMGNRVKSLPTELDTALAKKASDALKGQDIITKVTAGTAAAPGMSLAQATALGVQDTYKRAVELLKKADGGNIEAKELSELVSKYRQLQTSAATLPPGTVTLSNLDTYVPAAASDIKKFTTNADEFNVYTKLGVEGKPVSIEELNRIGITTTWTELPPGAAPGAVPIPKSFDPKGTFQDPGQLRQVLETNARIKGGEANIKKLEDDVKNFGAQQKAWESVYKGASKRLQTSVMVGGLWLGPARFAFSINSAILFQFRAQGTDDKYVRLLISKPDIAGEFRRATNTLGSGTLLEALGDFTGGSTPKKAFNVGNVILFNQAKQTNDGSRTSLVEGGIATAWKGQSEAANFEDIKGFQKDQYTSLALETNAIAPDAAIEHKREFEGWTYALGLIVPLVATRGLKDIPNTLYSLVPFLAINDYVMQVDPGHFANGQCDDSTISSYKNAYRAAIIAGQVTSYFPAVSLANAYKTTLTGIGKLIATKSADIAGTTLAKGAGKIFQVADLLNVPTAFQWYIGNRALNYVSTCRDSKYTILAYQQIAGAPAADLTSKLKPAGDLTKNLNIGDLFKGVGQKVDQANLPEILNVRAILKDQFGYVKPQSLYYFHLDGGNTQWHGSFSGRPACFQMNLQSKNGNTVSLGNNGVVLKDKDGNIIQSFSGPDWQRRALLAMMRQDLARQIVPNRIISTPLACAGAVTAFEVDGNARLFTRASSCAGVTCLQQRLSELTGKAVSDDLSAVLGPVQRVYTTEGVVTMETGGFARFLRLTAKDTTLPGQETQTPSIASELAGATKQASSVLIMGDAQVKLRGQMNTNQVEEQTIGQLQTVVTSNARIEYDPSSGSIHLALYVLSEAKGEQVQRMDTNLVKNPDGSTGITIDNLQPKPGEGATVGELQRAIKKLQQDGGFQQFDTANKTYAFGVDENGNPVLRIIDKNTGKVETLKITGPITRDPVTGDITVPTDKGEYRFNFDMKNGVPTMTVTDPNGFKEIAALLAARAPGGILVFDPATGKWQLLNGQDIPMNQDFANKGLSLLGSPDGAKGVPSDGLLSLPKLAGRGSTGLNPIAALPSWPEENWLQMLMLATLVGGVLAVRFRYRRPSLSLKQPTGTQKGQV